MRGSPSISSAALARLPDACARATMAPMGPLRDSIVSASARKLAQAGPEQR